MPDLFQESHKFDRLAFGRAVFFFTFERSYEPSAAAAVVAAASAVRSSGNAIIAAAARVTEQKDDDKENAPVV